MNKKYFFCGSHFTGESCWGRVGFQWETQNHECKTAPTVLANKFPLPHLFFGLNEVLFMVLAKATSQDTGQCGTLQFYLLLFVVSHVWSKWAVSPFPVTQIQILVQESQQGRFLCHKYLEYLQSSNCQACIEVNKFRGKAKKMLINLEVR